MKIGILIPCYNRPEYLKQCLWSLERVELPEFTDILIIDDCSTNADTVQLIDKFTHQTARVFKQRSPENAGIKKVLLCGYNDLFSKLFNNDLVINFDSDAIIHPTCITELIKHYIPGTLLTAFHSTTRAANGDERHIIISEQQHTYLKRSVGGINFCIDKQAYENHVKPALQVEIGNWDNMACISAGGAYCLKTSLVQHIGFDSTLNHFENPDTADTFKYWDLPTVTLIGVDSNADRLHEAVEKCTEWIRFGDVVELNPPLNSKEAYSNFCIDELYKHVHTEHLLICQYDGYVHNWQAWDDNWLQYDYIGAPWHYNDGMAVGNGGFSLRSRRLMEILSTDPYIRFKHPEDHHICRTYRPYLETTYGIKFAPVEVAERFSFEGYMQPGKYLNTQFGRHGTNIRTSPVAGLTPKRLIPNQFLSLGDILFLIPMIRELMNEGNEVIWPIDERYMGISKHFPDIPFVCKQDYDLPYDRPERIQTTYGEMLPYRFASELMGRTLKDCMRSKYELYKHDYRIWRNLYWMRDIDNEVKLLRELDLPERFVLVNRYFGHLSAHTIEPRITSDLPIVEMRNIPGYTLIDWLYVVERASELHIANSSLNYLIELMDLKIPVHVYKRGIWGETGFEYSRYLFENKCFIWEE